MGHSQLSQPEHRNTLNSQNSLHQNVPVLNIRWQRRMEAIRRSNLTTLLILGLGYVVHI